MNKANFEFPEEEIPERMKFLLEPKRSPKVIRVITIEEKRAIINAYADDRSISEIALLLNFTETEIRAVLFGSKASTKKKKRKKPTREQKKKRATKSKRERAIINEAKFKGII